MLLISSYCCGLTNNETVDTNETHLSLWQVIIDAIIIIINSNSSNSYSSSDVALQYSIAVVKLGKCLLHHWCIFLSVRVLAEVICKAIGCQFLMIVCTSLIGC